MKRERAISHLGALLWVLHPLARRCLILAVDHGLGSLDFRNALAGLVRTLDEIQREGLAAEARGESADDPPLGSPYEDRN